MQTYLLLSCYCILHQPYLPFPSGMAATSTVWSIKRLPSILESSGNDTAGCVNFYIILWNWIIGGLVGITLIYFSLAWFLKSYLQKSSRDHWLWYQWRKEECREGSSGEGGRNRCWYWRRENVGGGSEDDAGYVI